MCFLVSKGFEETNPIPKPALNQRETCPGPMVLLIFPWYTRQCTAVYGVHGFEGYARSVRVF